ncbi:hypothetical protein BGM26_07540 [Bacillus sp. FJAT-29790]|uniref:hypothetical protein n=1 Tax=Bacillus sp. FJAT-29790 TaxID=1895002 RepID=UPI001C24A60E|nr:hypothetical protein [Bacillus sp. FJAT-29790]MBU8878838.1 hypothetical protein [Bacillus sp. FJAT-29790]
MKNLKGFKIMDDIDKDNLREKSSSSLSKLIKRIWYVSLAVGPTTTMLQGKFPFKEMFWIISISSLILAFSCAVMLFKKDFALVERILYSIATIVLLFMNPHWLDIPAYLTNDYRVVEGIPTEFEYRYPYKAGSYLHVKVQNEELNLPTNVPESHSDRWFVIHYLPNSKFIMDYKILSKQARKKN